MQPRRWPCCFTVSVEVRRVLPRSLMVTGTEDGLPAVTDDGRLAVSSDTVKVSSS